MRLQLNVFICTILNELVRSHAGYLCLVRSNNSLHPPCGGLSRLAHTRANGSVRGAATPSSLRSAHARAALLAIWASRVGTPPSSACAGRLLVLRMRAAVASPTLYFLSYKTFLSSSLVLSAYPRGRRNGGTGALAE